MNDITNNTAPTTDKAKGSVFIIAASSGTGKTSLVKELVADIDNLDVSISYTTRAPRPNEENGVHYHFTTVEDFKTQIATGDFLEYAEVFGNFYGTSKSSLQEQTDAGIDVILEIDWQGALQVKEHFPHVHMIFILPPSREALRERLSNRGQDSSEVIENRLAGSITEMQQYDKFDYLVINNDFQQALTELKNIILTTRLGRERQQIHHRSLIDSLLNE